MSSNIRGPRPAGGWLHSSADPSVGTCDTCGDFTNIFVLEENLGCCSIGCVLDRKKDEKEEDNKNLLPCRSCSAYFHPDISADGYHCSPLCAMEGPPFSGGVLPPPEPAPLEKWIALGHTLPCQPPASPPASSKMTAASSGPLLKRSTSTSPAYKAETIEAEKLQMDLCQHWWPLNAPTACPYC